MDKTGNDSRLLNSKTPTNNELPNSSHFTPWRLRISIVTLLSILLLSFLSFQYTYEATPIESRDSYFSPNYQDLNVKSVFSPIEDINQLEIDYKELVREVKLTEIGVIRFKDYFCIANNGSDDLRHISIFLPKGANSLSAYDTIGVLEINIDQTSIETAYKYSSVTVSIRSDIKRNEITRFSVTYEIPLSNYVKVLDLNFYKFESIFSEILDLGLEDLSVFILPPEGAKILSFSEGGEVTYDGAFQERVAYETQSLESPQVLDLSVDYEYQFLWISFRPTLWISLLVLSAYIIMIVPQKFKPKSISVKKDEVPGKLVRDYVEAFEERGKRLFELKAINDRSRRRRLPKRQRDKQRSLLNRRISVISNNMNKLSDKIRTAGPRYADIMREIEISETELAGIEAEIERIRRQYQQGNLSSAAFRQLLKENIERRESTKGKLEGILLRLRETIN